MRNSNDLSRVKIEASEDYFVSSFRNRYCFGFYSIGGITRILVQRRREGSANVGRDSITQRIHKVKHFAYERILEGQLIIVFLDVKSGLNKSVD
jgi:hypothetical protein